MARKLYAVACERFSRGQWTADIVYLHANSQTDARLQFVKAEPNRRKVRVVAVGPAVGYFVDDKEGKHLSV